MAVKMERERVCECGLLSLHCGQFGTGTGASGAGADLSTKPTTVPQPSTAVTATAQPKEYTETNIQVNKLPFNKYSRKKLCHF